MGGPFTLLSLCVRTYVRMYVHVCLHLNGFSIAASCVLSS